MEPSSYQKAIFDFIDAKDGGNAVVQAVAGSGKSTTLEMASRRMSARVKSVAFNKAVAEKAKLRMPPNVDSSTLHSVGSAAWGRVELARDKSRRIYKYLQDKGLVPRWLQPGKVCKIVGLAKNEGLVPDQVNGMVGLVEDTEEQWLRIFDHHNVDTDERVNPAVLISATRLVLTESIRWAGKIIDFDDMLYMPTLTTGCTFPSYSWVFVDELQDVSGLQREMILRMVEKSGRFLGVGDRAQAIYGWRGADVASMDKIVSITESKELPLSICYRCPRKVIELAKEIVPQIEAAPDAEEGLVEYRESYKASEILPGDLIICRNRAPIIRLAYKLLGSGTKVRVLGQSVGQGILTFIESFKCSSIDGLLGAIARHTTLAVAKAEKNDDEQAVQDALDLQDTIIAICEGSRASDVATLCDHVKEVFDGPIEGKVLVGTIHAVKGLEADNVWFLERNLIPSRGARKEWQQVQEKNLLYVGITRAHKTLRFIKSEGLR